MTAQAHKLVLASQSPARQELVERLRIDAIIAPQDIDETPYPKELPRPHVARLAEEKAESGAKNYSDHYILAADTIVVVGRRILGKATDENGARAHLNILSGTRHQVITGICLRTPSGKNVIKVVCTKIQFKRLTKSEIDKFITTGDWQGKSGSYGMFAAPFVKSIHGSPSNVLGLPLYEVNNMLTSHGFYSK